MSDAPPWLASALAYIRQWVSYQMRLTEQPGCTVAVARGDDIVFEAAFGHASLNEDRPLTSRDRFRVASHSKTFTAAAIMKLREQGRLKLDDIAGDFVAGLHPEVATATISQILSHTAGLFRDGLESSYWEGRAPFHDEAALRRDLTLAPVIVAGSRLKYSNHGFALAGLIIEAVTGEAYQAWMQREIVLAAGLGETTPDVPLRADATLARGHGERTLLGRRLEFTGDQSTGALAAATGFVSTAADLARFFGQLSPDAPVSILSAASRREMIRPQWRDPFSALQTDYGLGVIISRSDGWDLFGHSGAFQGYISRTAAARDHGLAISVLTNAVDGAAHMLLDGVVHILSRFAAAGTTSQAVEDWGGRWWSVWGPTDLVAMGDKVLLASPGLPKPFLKASELSVLRPDEALITEAGAFRSHGEAVRRVRDAQGEITELLVASRRLLPEAELSRELIARYQLGAQAPS